MSKINHDPEAITPGTKDAPVPGVAKRSPQGERSGHMTFLQHLDQLRSKIIYCLIAIGICTCICYFWSKKIVEVLIRHLPHVVFISPYEVIIVYMKVSLFCGFILALPFIFLQMWSFIVTALSPRQKYYILGFTPLSCILFVLGFYFCYQIIVPASMNFFMSFSTERIVPMVSINKYISFVGGLCIFSGIIFQMPLLTVLLTKMKILTPLTLKNQWRHIIVGIFLLAAVITPSTDIFNQILLAGPMLALYGVSVVVAYVVGGKNN